MDHLVEQKCPACEAPMRFDPKLGKLVCDYCGTTMDIPEAPKQEAQEVKEEELKVEEATLDFDFASISGQAVDENAQGLPIYNCVSCGAEVIAPAEQMALTCPYCGNNIVLTEKVSGKLRPDGMIPFQLSSDELPGALQKFYKGKVLLPKRFFSESRVGKVTGVYVPFWVFGGKLSGELLYNASTSSTRRSGDYLVTETKHYRLRRDVALEFRDLPVDASGKVDDALMDSLEPFDYKAMVPFQGAYLAGFLADRFDADPDLCLPRATSRMNRSVEEVLGSYQTGGVSGVRLRNNAMALRDTAVHYVLLPVYLINCKYGGKSYQYAVNGQTGKIVGTLPISRSRSLLYRFRDLLIAGIPAAGIIALLSYIF